MEGQSRCLGRWFVIVTLLSTFVVSPVLAGPLHTAAEGGDLAKLKRLIGDGARANAKDGYGRTPLSWAASNGYKDVAQVLITNGADVNTKDNDYNTPLHLAAEKGHLDVAELLVANGAKVKAKNKRGVTPLVLATRAGDTAMVNLLTQKVTTVEREEVRRTQEKKVTKTKGKTEVSVQMTPRQLQSMLMSYAEGYTTIMGRAFIEFEAPAMPSKALQETRGQKVNRFLVL